MIDLQEYLIKNKGPCQALTLACQAPHNVILQVEGQTARLGEHSHNDPVKNVRIHAFTVGCSVEKDDPQGMNKTQCGRKASQMVTIGSVTKTEQNSEQAVSRIFKKLHSQIGRMTCN